MKSRRRSRWLLLAIVFGTPAHASECDSIESLRWLLGDWTAAGSKTTFHESWAAAGKQTFEGAGIERANADGAIQGAESLRLVEMAGGVYYVSKVSHNELPVAFRLTDCRDGRFVFDNPAHDFPRRLEYVHGTGDRLKVTVSDGADKGFALDFVRSAASLDTAVPVMAAEDARFAAMVAADEEGMRRWFAADLVYVHSNGQVENREQLMTSITSGRMRYVGVAPIERQVVSLGDSAALVRGHARFSVVANEMAMDLQIRYLAVYGYRDRVWQLRSWQSLRVP